MEFKIGRGVIRLADQNGQNGLYLGFGIHSDRISFFHLDQAGTSLTLHQAAGHLGSSLQGQGSLILNAWPASPRPTFETVSIQVTELTSASEEFELTVLAQDAFAQSGDVYFSNLELILRSKTGEPLSLGNTSKVTLHVGADSAELNALLDSENGLGFSGANPAQFQLGDLGVFQLDGEVFSSSLNSTEGLQLAYFFSEEGGNSSFDASKSAHPNLLESLKTRDKRKINPQRVPGGLSLDDSYFLQTDYEIRNVINEFRASEAFSVEVWIKAQSGTQTGPAQILAFQNRSKKNYFAIGQGKRGSDNQFISVQVENRSASDRWDDPLETENGSLGTDLTQVVFTHDPSGLQRIYLNGELASERQYSIDLDDWSSSLRLVVGYPEREARDHGGHGHHHDHFHSDHWEGEIHHLGVYNRALTSEEVFQHYAPELAMEGDFVLANVPAPLADADLAARLEVGQNASSLIAGDSIQRAILPNLSLNRISIQAEQVGVGPWTADSNLTAQIWNDSVELTGSPRTGAELLKFKSEVDTPLAFGIGGLESILFSNVELEVSQDGPGLEWELSAEQAVPFSGVPALLPIDVAIDSDFKLLNPKLGRDETDVQLLGKWLGKGLVLHTRELNGELQLEGSSTFSIPFSLDLPELIDEKTGARLADAQQIENVPMEVSLDMQLQEKGFLGILNASFSYTNASGAAQNISLPERRLYLPPASQNALLGEILEEVEANAAKFFAGQGRNISDYFIQIGTESPELFLSQNGTPQSAIATGLPLLFSTDTQITSTNNVFSLNQTGNNCGLQIDLQDSSLFRGDYTNLFDQLGTDLDAGAIALLKRRIAERLPLSFQDQMFFYYGLDVENGHMDLQAGMRLRIDVQNYQFVQASDPSAKRGFVGSGSFHVPINNYTYPQSDGSNAQLIGFGPFLSQLQANSSTDITNEGAGGLFDLLKDGNRKAFYRLFYPKQPSSGLGPERVVTIVGTDSLAEMETVTRDFNPDGNVLPSVGSSFFFRGKAMVIPEIQVFVGNIPVYVPVGTTLRQLIEMYDEVPAAGMTGQDLTAFAGNTRPLRLVHEGPSSKAEYRFVNVGDGEAVKNLDALDMPLIKGDRFNF